MRPSRGRAITKTECPNYEYAIIARLTTRSARGARFAVCMATALTMDVENAQFLLSGNTWMTYFEDPDSNEKKRRRTQSALLKMRLIRGEFHNQYFDVRGNESLTPRGFIAHSYELAIKHFSRAIASRECRLGHLFHISMFDRRFARTKIARTCDDRVVAFY